MELLAIKLEGKREELQCIQVLVPLRHLSLNPNVCGLRRCLRVRYGDKELPLKERMIFWDINNPKD
jgi:hypothetical protein